MVYKNLRREYRDYMKGCDLKSYRDILLFLPPDNGEYFEHIWDEEKVLTKDFSIFAIGIILCQEHVRLLGSILLCFYLSYCHDSV